VAKRIPRSYPERGLPPGTLAQGDEGERAPARIAVIDYDAERVEQREVASARECLAFRDRPSVTWINLDTVRRTDVVRELGEHFDIHPIILEDIVNLQQRPKMEDLDSSLYVVLQMLYCRGGRREVAAEQVSLILGKDFVMSFQERAGDVFDFVRDRILNSKGRIRQMGPDYLLYSLMDAVVDNYFVVLERLGERIDPLEEAVVSDPVPQTLRAIQRLRRELLFLRRCVWPLRDVVGSLQRCDSALITQSTALYFRDLYDHVVQVIEAVESFRETLSGMLDIYLSTVSNRMNEVMKVLTVIATLFIPLTFVTGIYGMNFRFMPEVHWRYGYPLVLFIMWALCAFMLLQFRRKKWL